MASYKLYYFDARGLTEPIRFLFAYSGQEYEDIRVAREDWPGKKAGTPFKQLPYLEVDGVALGQSNAIGRLVAKRFNLAGNGDVEQARVDALVDYVSDMRGGIYTWFREADEGKKAELRAKYFNETLPEYLGVFDEHLNKNGGGFLVGSGPTYADFVLANFLYGGHVMQPGCLDKYPALKEHMERVNNLKGIKEWIAKRPDTQN